MTEEMKKRLAEVEKRVLAKAKGQNWNRLQLRQAISQELESLRVADEAKAANSRQVLT